MLDAVVITPWSLKLVTNREVILECFTSSDHCVVENEAGKTIPLFPVKTCFTILFSKHFRLQLPKNVVLRIGTSLIPRPSTLKGDAVSPHSSSALGIKKEF